MSPALFLRWSVRQLRGERARVLLFTLCVALGAAAVVGSAALREAIEVGLRLRSRELLGGDLAVESRRPLPDIAGLLPAPFRELPRADLTILSTMVRSASGQSRLAELKAVQMSHGAYPLAGTLRLFPSAPVAQLLDDDSALVAPALAEELQLAVGGTLYVGDKALRVAGLVEEESDPVVLSFTSAPRVLLTARALSATQLITFGSRVRHRSLLRFPDGTPEATVARVQEQLKQRIPGGQSYVRVESHQDAQPALRNILDRVQRYLGLLALLSLLIASVGVAQVTAAWLRRNARDTAVLRCLGLRPREVFALYLSHVLLLALVGSLLGAALGLLAPQAVARLDPALIPASALQVLPWRACLRGVLLGVGSAALFSVPPLISVWRVPPSLVLRSTAVPLPTPLSLRAAAISAAALGLFGAALLQGESAGLALGFSAGVAGLAGLLALSARALSWLLSRVPRGALPPLSWSALAALARPDAGLLGGVVALGLGTLVVLSVLLLQRLLAGAILSALPANAPNLFLVDIQPDQWPGVQQLTAQHGAQDVQSAPVIMARLSAIDGQPVERLLSQRQDQDRGTRDEWALTREQRITSAEVIPADNRVVEGRLWSDPDAYELSVERGFARDIGLRLGSLVRFDVQGIPVELKVTSLRTVEWRSFAMNFFLVAEPGALDGAPQIRLGALRLAPSGEQPLQDALAARFPNVSVLRVRALLARAHDVLSQASLIVQLLGAFSALTGVVILLSSVAASQLRRAREAALLKALGLTRLRIVLMFGLEFALLGALSGLLGSLAAFGLVATLARQVLELEQLPSLALCAAAVLLTTLLSVLGGLFASARALLVRPLQVLRSAQS